MYDPSIHHRKSLRLQGYDYSQAGLYFITICCHNKQCRFGHISMGKMLLSEYGLIAAQQWEKLPERYPNTALDDYQIMPNHMHGILHITDVRAPVSDGPLMCSLSLENRVPARGTPTCGDIIGSYKSLVFDACLEIYKAQDQIMGKLWQRNFYEHIIRSEKSYNIISDYIIHNPQTWNEDLFYMSE